MALWDFLKKKKDGEKARTGEAKKSERKAEKILAEGEPKEAKSEKTPKFKQSKKDVKGFSYEIVKEPHISEKSTALNERNQYVFKIYRASNKPEVKKAVEGIYGVDVVSVRVIKIPKKKRRLGRTEGFRKAYAKAVVTIKEGQKIEIY